MNRFEYIRADSITQAIQALATPNAQALAGGTNLVDLMKYDVAKPARVVDINRLPLRTIEEAADGGLKIGALVSNSDLAWEPRIVKRYPLLASAILAFCSVHAVTISMIPRPPATSGSRAAAAQPSTASIASTPSLARAISALPFIPLTCVWRWPRSMRLSTWRGPKADARCPSASFTDCRKIVPSTTIPCARVN
jgi:hypothetical protein